MEGILVDREALLAALLPWDHPNFGTDEGWIRAYPYEIETGPGGGCLLEVRATNHSDQPQALLVDPVLPPGWTSRPQPPQPFYPLPVQEDSIVCARLSITVPPETPPGVYPLAFRVTWGGRYLGQVCHALVKVWSNDPPSTRFA
jgi:hypothetical protein